MKKEADQIAINPAMLAILNRFKQNTFAAGSKRKRKVALTQLRVGKMKRKQAPRATTTLDSKIADVKQLPAMKLGPNPIYKIKRQRPNGIGAEKEDRDWMNEAEE